MDTILKHNFSEKKLKTEVFVQSVHHQVKFKNLCLRLKLRLFVIA